MFELCLLIARGLFLLFGAVGGVVLLLWLLMPRRD
jgi:hypothetical protein